MEIDSRMTKALDGAPVNIVARPNMSATDLEQIGAARVSIASGATLAVMSLVINIAEELHASHRFDGLKHSMDRPEAQALFKPRD
jgi:2-methylisocitrate lyase-like PEP mutase family enzyme